MRADNLSKATWGIGQSQRRIAVACLTALTFWPTVAAAAEGGGFFSNLLDSIEAWWSNSKTAATERLVAPEEFASVMPGLVRARGVGTLVGKEIKNLGEGPEVFTVTVSYFDTPDGNGRPIVLWIDKIEGSATTRYADIDSDGILDGVTFDGKPVLSKVALSALLTGNRDMAAATFRKAKEEAERFQPKYQADYSKAMRLALARYPDAELAQNDPLDSEPSPQDETTIPTTPTPTPKPTPVAAPAPRRTAPQDAVMEFFNGINRGDYWVAWAQLSVALQEDKKRHPTGYTGFLEWHSGMRPITVTDLQVRDDSPNESRVYVSYSYVRNGATKQSSQCFHMVWDTARQRWVAQSIDKWQ